MTASSRDRSSSRTASRSVMIRQALERAIELLMVAATSGKRADIKAATDQIEIVLQTRQLIGTAEP